MFSKIKNSSFFILIFVLFAVINAGAQNNNAAPLDAAAKTKAVNNYAKLLEDKYVFPDKGKQMAEFIKSQLKNGAYDTVTSPMIFSDILTNDVRSITNDKHLRLMFSPDEAKRIEQMHTSSPNAEFDKQMLEQMKKENSGFKKIEILPGNTGYIDFRAFAPAEVSKETVASVMAFVANCDALIFDIRKNGGGSPDGVRLICSYLFGSDPVHLNDIYTRANNSTEQYWTLKSVDGKKMPNVPVYILTSNFTFSGAEEFAYDLKNQKRATIIGEVTGGGANPGETHNVDGNFVAFIPDGRAISPVTNTNWEGTGVEPDVMISSEKALDKAQILILNSMLSSAKDEMQKKRFEWLIGSLSASMDAGKISESTMQSYAGEYGERTITFEGGSLYYQRKGRPKFQMTVMNEKTFMFKDLDYFRIRFNTDTDGKVNGLTGMYDDGHEDTSARTN